MSVVVVQQENGPISDSTKAWRCLRRPLLSFIHSFIPTYLDATKAPHKSNLTPKSDLWHGERERDGVKNKAGSRMDSAINIYAINTVLTSNEKANSIPRGLYLLLLVSASDVVSEHNDVENLQGSAKEWSLGCVKRAPAARGGQDAGITQPRDHSLADPCI